MASLVVTLDSLNQYDQSAILETEILEKRGRILGAEQRDTIAAANNLAITLDRLGRLEEAVSMRKEVLEKRKRILWRGTS
jgi:hypothetical protein